MPMEGSGQRSPGQDKGMEHYMERTVTGGVSCSDMGTRVERLVSEGGM